MTVVHSCTSESFSGLERYMLDLATWQYRNGKSVELYCRAGTELEKTALARGLPVWAIGAKDRPGPLLWAKMYREWQKRFDRDEITLHMHAGGEPWFHLPWLVKKNARMAKAILHFHIWINHRKKNPVHRTLYAGLDEVWTSSETARAHLASLLPIDRNRIRVVPYGRDVKTLIKSPRAEWRRDERNRLGVGDDEMLGVCVSRLEPIKGVGELFDAFVRIAPKNPKAQLVIVGDASPNNDEAQRFASDLRAKYQALPTDVRRRLHLPGFVAGSERVIAAGDFYVLPSYEECMSLAMLDAVILGLPVLGTNSGGTPSVARPDETGALVPPRDVNALAQALEDFYQDPALCQRLGAGAKALGSNFDQDDIFRRIWDWYGTHLSLQ